MGCAAFIVKYALFISNFVVSLLGLAVIGLGIAVLVALRDLNEILPVNIVPISLIVLGVAVFVIGFLACCGAITESRCMLICYSIVVCLLIGAFIYLTVLFFGHLNNIEETVRKWIDGAFEKTQLRPVFRALEITFRCCGPAGAVSYLTTEQVLPSTCCANPTADSTCATDDAYGGCSTLVGEWFRTFMNAIASVLLVVVIVQATAVLFALYLCRSITKKNRANLYVEYH